MNKTQQSNIERTGATNQLAMITLSFIQLILLEPTAARPEPIIAPTTVWVPEIGMPKIEEVIMKMKLAIDVPNIIFSIVGSSRVSKFSITLPTRWPATCPLHQNAPMNSKMLPRITSQIKRSALEPYEVARAFAASFEPIANDIQKDRIPIETR